MITRFFTWRYSLLPILMVCCNICLADITIGSTQVCNGDTTTLYNLSNIPNTVLVQWDLNDAGFYNTGTGDTVKYVFPSPGTLYVNIKITDVSGNVYYNTSPLAVTVYAVPVVNFTYSGICNGQTTTLTNLSSITGTDALQYVWDFTNSGAISSTLQNTSVAYPAPGNYTCVLQVTSSHNCSSVNQQVITIATNPTVSFDYSNPCQGSEVVFVNTSDLYSDSLVQSIWALGDGTLSFNPDSVFHIYNRDTNYSVGLSVRNSHGCVDSINKSLAVNRAVLAAYNYAPDSVIYPGYSTTIQVTGNFSSILWNDGTTLASKTVSDSGYYKYTASNQWGCTQTDVAHVQLITAKPAIEKANDIITPNGDGINDVLAFKNLESFNVCKIKIYNVSGLEVYSSDSYKNDWNAANNGKPANAGTYYYVITCDDQYELKGNTNVIR